MNAIQSVFKELGITEKSAIREYALLSASQKLAEFDYLAWRFAFEGRAYWQKKIDQLRKYS